MFQSHFSSIAYIFAHVFGRLAQVFIDALYLKLDNAAGYIISNLP